ncbi:MAG: response regulator transcription factor [Nocardioides sp.]|uniref:response regulator transcription factor n=1 Tax=Nocardioides sp. TaxID=35761 RepID=UPI003F11066D
MSSHTLLVVEDERAINDALALRLRSVGYEVHQAFDGHEALRLAEEHQVDLVVLDLMLPGVDGYEVCRRLQAERPVPVLMLTARDDENDVIVGLGVGADDYLTKPFRIREVVARVAALLRRVERAEEAAVRGGSDVLTAGAVVVDRAARRVSVSGTEVHLTPTEFDLLVCLARDPGRVLSREALLSEVWDWVDAAGTRTVDSHVKALRAKLGPGRVRTVHGVGYALEVQP